MNGWREVLIGSLCLGIYDGPHATPKKTADGPVFLGISSLDDGRLNLSDTEHLSEDDFRTWTRRVTPRPGDIVFSYETRLGQAAAIPEGMRCCLGRRMALMRPNPAEVDPRFLLYAYLGPSFQEVIRSRTIHGSTVDRIPLIDFPTFPIRVPDLPEQRAIAHILGTLDDKIALNRRTNHTLEEIARALFTSWFVTFVPVRAKAEGRQPEGMDVETAALFPAAFECSAMGQVPERWRVEPLSNVADINPSRPLRKGEAAPYLDMANVPTAGPRAIEWTSRPYGSGTRFRNGDVLLARITPCLENGKTAFVDFLADGEIGWGSTEFIVLRARSPLPPAWAYCVARDHAFREFAIRSMSGTSGRQRVPAEAAGRYKVIVPPAAIAEKFGRLVSPMFHAIRNRDDDSRTLAALRDTLLPRLLSGELPVSGFESSSEGSGAARRCCAVAL